MKLFALCTSGPAASAALLEDGRLLDEENGEVGLTHSETIIPICDALLKRNGLFVSDIDLFAADTGPGSFTGVRIGVCAANAFAYAAGRSVVGVSALFALAFGYNDGNVCSLLDARNGNGYAACYQQGRCTLPPTPVTIADFVATLPEDTLFIGEHEQHKELILSLLPTATFCKDNLLTAAKVALAAWSIRDAASREVYPLYLRPSQAERLFEERHHG